MYFSEVSDNDVSRLNSQQKLILYCIYTRSSDGHLREKYLKKMLENDFPKWCIPYIIKLSDEYVIEIISVIYMYLKDRDNNDIRDFCLTNEAEVYKSYSRMISYWNEYYRSCWRNLKQYPGYKLYMECFGVSEVK